MIRRALTALLVASLAACVSARDCATSIPEDYRADVLRFVVDRNFVDVRLLPRDDYALGLGAGRRFEELDEARRSRVAMYASGYVSCIHDRVERL